MLVLSKVYLVTKGSLVPLFVSSPDRHRPRRVGDRRRSRLRRPWRTSPSEPTRRRGRIRRSPSTNRRRRPTPGVCPGLVDGIRRLAPGHRRSETLGGPWSTVWTCSSSWPERSGPAPPPGARHAGAQGSTAKKPAEGPMAGGRRGVRSVGSDLGPLPLLGPAALDPPGGDLRPVGHVGAEIRRRIPHVPAGFDLRRAHATVWYGPTLGLSIAGAVVGVSSSRGRDGY